MKTLTTLFVFALAAIAVPTLRGADDIVIADFESPSYGDWKVTGEAFGPGPAHGQMPGQMAVDGYEGQRLVNSFYKGDSSTGTLTSPEFSIQRKYIRFLIGGGGFVGKTCMNLLVNSKVVRTATGPNTKPGGSEHLDWQQWDVTEFSGKRAIIQIVDQATGGWGHINVDQITQTDLRMPMMLKDVAREITVEKRYLNLPIKNGAPKRVVKFIVNGKTERQFDMELADGQPDWWAFLDLAPFKGQKAVIRVDQLREDSGGLKNIEQLDEIKNSADLYREPLRPQFHFTVQRGWNNDPNGLVYYKGEYHLFYQHNPYGWDWGNMHWGHAVSPDLVHWTELPEALYPDSLGTMFSGSAVIDYNNTAGFKTADEDVMVCFYTAAGNPFTQCLAYSNDRGRTFTKYEKNPILPHIAAENRDPKVFWYEPQKKWIMALYLDNNDFALFSSTNLKQWHRLCTVTVPGASECPEFFEISLDGTQEKRWVFYGANGFYLVGKFDGWTFKPESGPHHLNQGNCFYASQTYNNIPEKDGRRILIPWGQMATPGMPFNQMVGIPVELTLHNTAEGPRLFAVPVRELAGLRGISHPIQAQEVSEGQNPLAGIRSELIDLTAEVALGDAAQIQFTLRGVPVTYDVAKQELSCRDRKATLKSRDRKIQIRMLVDRTSVDIFANDGQVYMPMGVIVPQEERSMTMKVSGGRARIESMQVYELKSAWAK